MIYPIIYQDKHKLSLSNSKMSISLKLSRSNSFFLEKLFKEVSLKDFTCSDDIYRLINSHNTNSFMKSNTKNPSTQCNSRAFRGGRGGRCKKSCEEGYEFCKNHLKPWKGKPPSYCKECSKHTGKEVFHVLNWEHQGRYNEPCNIPHFTGEDDLMPSNKKPNVPVCQIGSSEEPQTDNTLTSQDQPSTRKEDQKPSLIHKTYTSSNNTITELRKCNQEQFISKHKLNKFLERNNLGGIVSLIDNHKDELMVECD